MCFKMLELIVMPLLLGVASCLRMLTMSNVQDAGNLCVKGSALGMGPRGSTYVFLEGDEC